MREEFQADLVEVNRLLVTMAEAVRAALRKATTALLTADLEAAEAVMERDAEVDEIYRQVEAKVADTIARQAPVASDLRTVITALHVSADLERMGDLAEHVAKTARRRHPSPAVPAELRPVFQQMSEVASRMADKITSGTYSRSCSTTTGPTASRPGSTGRCWDASTSGTPTMR
jgi:phosphate transport system protein